MTNAISTFASFDNDDTIQAWNSVLFDKFVRFRRVLSRGLNAHGDAAMDRYCEGKYSRVVDLGCGFGDSTMRLAERVAFEAVGIDAASRFIDEARRTASERRINNARFAVVDVENAPLGGPYDLAFSQFGTMFFSRPVAALKRVRESLTPGGRLCMVVWRCREDNPVVHLAETIARRVLPPVIESDEPTCGPGPFSMASANVVSDILVAAGFRNVTLERQDLPIHVGADLEEAVDFALQLGPAGELVRLAGAAGELLLPTLTAALREALTKFATDEGISMPSSTWIVSALA
jgi:ubiquinone/menaquinone biosynthesis C-methylase UbiE